MRTDAQILQRKASVRTVYIIIYLTGLVLLSLHLPFEISDRHRVWFVPVFALCGAFWLVDVFMTRIVLGKDNIRIVSVSDFKSRTIPRAEINNVTWAKGCGASLLLRDGKGVRLPSVGRNAQGLTNTIRAWLNRA